MKKILFATLMFTATIGNANAFEFETNNNSFITSVINQIVKQTVHQTVGSQVGDGKHVIVHTGNASRTGNLTRCWTSTIYRSDGTPMPQVVCY